MLLRTAPALLSLLIVLGLNLPARAGEAQIGLIEHLDDGQNQIKHVVPNVHITLAADESLHSSILPAFTATWEGMLAIQEKGAYRFWFEGELKIDQQLVGADSIELTAGKHDVQLQYRRMPGAVKLDFSWESSLFKRETISGRFLFHHEDTQVDNAIVTGRRLFHDYGCLSCHEAKGARASALDLGPDLSDVGLRTTPAWIVKWLENPQDFQAGARMPVLSLSQSERRDIATYLTGVSDTRERVASKPSDEGRALFESIGCIACHNERQLLLKGLGSKYDAPGLREYLLHPQQVDRSGRMPGLFFMNTREEKEHERMLEVDPDNRMPFMFRNQVREREKEAQLIAAYLVHDHRPEYETAFMPGDAAHGEKLIQSAGCLNCHALRPRPDLRAKLITGVSEAGHVQQSPWQLLGPFNHTGKHSDVFPPEKKLDLQGEYEGATGKIRFQPVDFSDGEVHDLFDNRPNTMAFLYRTIETDRELYGTLNVGSDDTITVFVNRERVFEFGKPRGMPQKKDLVSIHLKPGTNEILLKVGNDGAKYQFYYQLGELSSPLVSSLKTIPLTLNAIADSGCLAEVSPRAPHYPLSTDDRAALISYLKFLAHAPEQTRAPPDDFLRTVETLKCNSCHTLNGRQPAPGLQDYPPSLSEVGDKLRPEWLERVLLQRQRVRPWMKTRMPQFSADATKQVMTEITAASPVSLEPELHETATGFQSGAVERGLSLIGKGPNGLGCIECHDFRGQSSRGVRGPELTEMYERIRPQWFRRWLRQPLRIQPGTAMPTFFGAVPDESGEKKIDDLRALLSLGAGIPKPAGLPNDEAHILTVGESPLVIRCAMPDSSPRSIAVGLPGLLSYCFDAQACSVRYVWYGEFLDVTPLRTGMGARSAIPLGKRVFAGTELCPLRGSDDTDPKVKFRGYTLVNDHPKFHFEVNGIDVWEFIEVLPGKPTLQCSFELGSSEQSLHFLKAAGSSMQADQGTWQGDRLQLPKGCRAFSLLIELDPKK